MKLSEISDEELISMRKRVGEHERKKAAADFPWTFDERYDSSCGWACTPDGCHDSHPSGVYDIDGPDGVNDFGEADVLTVSSIEHARLITAAPALRDALEEALIFHMLGDDESPEAWVIIEIMEAAIKLVEGG